MAQHNETDTYYIGPYWVGIIVSLLAFIVFCFLLNEGGIRPYRPWESVSPLHLILFAGLAAAACRTYTLDSSGITVRIFGLAIRRLRWNQFGQVVVIRSRTGAISKHSDGVIFVPRADCAPFRIDQDSVNKYAGRYPFRLFTINGSTKKIDEYAQAFQRFYEHVTVIDTHK